MREGFGELSLTPPARGLSELAGFLRMRGTPRRQRGRQCGSASGGVPDAVFISNGAAMASPASPPQPHATARRDDITLASYLAPYPARSECPGSLVSCERGSCSPMSASSHEHARGQWGPTRRRGCAVPSRHRLQAHYVVVFWPTIGDRHTVLRAFQHAPAFENDGPPGLPRPGLVYCLFKPCNPRTPCNTHNTSATLLAPFPRWRPPPASP